MTIIEEKNYTIDGHKVTVKIQKQQIDILDKDGNKIIVDKRKGKILLNLNGIFEFRDKRQ